MSDHHPPQLVKQACTGENGGHVDPNAPGPPNAGLLTDDHRLRYFGGTFVGRPRLGVLAIAALKGEPCAGFLDGVTDGFPPHLLLCGAFQYASRDDDRARIHFREATFTHGDYFDLTDTSSPSISLSTDGGRRRYTYHCDGFTLEQVAALLEDLRHLEANPATPIRREPWDWPREDYIREWLEVRPHHHGRNLVRALAGRCGVSVRSIINWNKFYGYPLHESVETFGNFPDKQPQP